MRAQGASLPQASQSQSPLSNSRQQSMYRKSSLRTGDNGAAENEPAPWVVSHRCAISPGDRDTALSAAGELETPHQAAQQRRCHDVRATALPVSSMREFPDARLHGNAVVPRPTEVQR